MQAQLSAMVSMHRMYMHHSFQDLDFRVSVCRFAHKVVYASFSGFERHASIPLIENGRVSAELRQSSQDMVSDTFGWRES